MKVLKATQQQYEALEEYTNANAVISFEKDKNGNWIVGRQVLADPAFQQIKIKLEQLEEIDFEPITEDTEADYLNRLNELGVEPETDE